MAKSETYHVPRCILHRWAYTTGKNKRKCTKCDTKQELLPCSTMFRPLTLDNAPAYKWIDVA